MIYIRDAIEILLAAVCWHIIDSNMTLIKVRGDEITAFLYLVSKIAASQRTDCEVTMRTASGFRTFGA